MLGASLYVVALALGLAFLLVPLLLQFLTPLLAACGIHRYHSSFLFTVEDRQGIHLHLGTSYDILWKLRSANRRDVRREILLGLRRFCNRIPPHARISVCTWFLSPKKMRRLGFTEERAPLWEKLDLAGGYLEILLQQFLLTRRLRFFNPFTIPCFSITAADLTAEALRRKEEGTARRAPTGLRLCGDQHATPL